MSKKWCLYIHKNKINGKVYVGITSNTDNPNLRWRNGKHYEANKHFTSAIEKYGWDNFEHMILYNDIKTEEEATKLEKETIEKYNALDKECGYNILEGGKGYQGGYEMTSSHRKNISDSLKKFYKNFRKNEEYETWLEMHKKPWTEDRKQKAKKTREYKKELSRHKPICELKFKSANYFSKGKLCVGKIYNGLASMKLEFKTEEKILKETNRVHNKLKKNEQIELGTYETKWIYLEDAMLIFNDLNPVVYYNSKTGEILKVCKRKSSLKKENQEEIEKHEMNKEHIWAYYKDYLKLKCPQ